MSDRQSPDVMTALAGIPKLGTGIGLHRMLWLRDALEGGEWLAGLDAVKVTGSNGKGSVCAMLAAVFDRLGVSCGLYTSPHLRDFRERIRVGGELIPPAELAASLAWTRRRIADYEAAYPQEKVGAFEAFTALALHHFARRRPRTVVSEAGIGGRFDSTRVLPGTLTALTSLDVEHPELLGGTLESIAYDKADICPDGGLLVVGAVGAEMLRRLKAYARLRGVEVVSVDEQCRLSPTRYAAGRMIVDAEIGGRRLDSLEIALPGAHQSVNAAVAVLLARAWAGKHLPELDEDVFWRAVRAGLRQVRWPGRFEQIAREPDFFVDVGHTPAAVEAVVRTVEAMLPRRRILLVTGASHDKNAEEIVGGLLAAADAVVCTRAWHKGSPVERIEGIVAARRGELDRWRAETVEEAVALARALALDRGMTVLVAGGLFLAVEAAESIHGRDPRDLRFF